MDMMNAGFFVFGMVVGGIGMFVWMVATAKDDPRIEQLEQQLWQARRDLHARKPVTL